MSEPKGKIVNQTETSRERVRLVGTGNLHETKLSKTKLNALASLFGSARCLRSELVLSRNQIVAAHYELFGNFQKESEVSAIKRWR